MPPPTPPPPKISWDTKDAGSNGRYDATLALCDFLKDLDPEERATYTVPKGGHFGHEEELKASEKSKAKFAELGGFYLATDPAKPADFNGIPAELMFRVYERGDPDLRDDIVTIVLPHLGEPTDMPAHEYYRCSYWPYKTATRP